MKDIPIHDIEKPLPNYLKGEFRDLSSLILKIQRGNSSRYPYSDKGVWVYLGSRDGWFSVKDLMEMRDLLDRIVKSHGIVDDVTEAQARNGDYDGP